MPDIQTEIKQAVEGLQKDLKSTVGDLEKRIAAGEAAEKGVAELKEQVNKQSEVIAKKVDDLFELKMKEQKEREDKLEAEITEKLRTSAAFKNAIDTPGIQMFKAATRKENPIDMKGVRGGGGKLRFEFKSWGLSMDHREKYPVLMGDVNRTQKAITNADASAGDTVDYMRVPGLIAPGQQALLIRDLLPVGRTSSDLVRFVRESAVTDATKVQAGQGTDKGESDFDFAADSEEVETIATYVRASTQILEDAVGLQSYIDSRLRYLVALKEESQLLTGDGTTNNLNGLITQASSFNQGLLTNLEVSNVTDLDRIRAGILQVTEAMFPATGIVLAPFNWAGIELLKDSTYQYIFTNPTTATAPRLWGLPVVPSLSMTNGEFLVGAFSLGAQIWDRMDAAVVLSTEDQDNFVKNLVTIRCEERLTLTVYRPSAFVTGDLSIEGSGS